MALTATQITDTASVDAVADRIAEFFHRKELMARSYGPRYEELWSAARAATEGGKRLRPAMVLNTFHTLGGGDDVDAIAVAAAFELLHTAFLLHDDVIDGDTMRRGRPNVAGVFSGRAVDQGISEASATAWGRASAILAGDLLIQAAQGMVATLRIDEERHIALLDLLETCVFASAVGELSDVAFTTAVDTPALSEVLAMTQWKTAHYSFQAPLQAGAVLADANPDTVRALGEFGRLIGIAFQLRDDVLGVFGAEQVTGKSASNDLRAGKVTPLMSLGLRRDDTGELHDLLTSRNRDDADVDRMRRLLEDGGTRRVIENLISDYSEEAMAAIETISVPENLREDLRVAARKACVRSS